MNLNDLFESPSAKDSISVGYDIIRKYPYYGMRGFLLLFYCLYALETVANVLSIFLPEIVGDISSFDNDIDTARLVYIWSVLTTLPLLILAPLKHPATPIVWIAGIWLNSVVYVVALDTPDDEGLEGYIYLF